MYAYLKGTLVEASTDRLILDVHGIGYDIRVPIHLFSTLPPMGSTVQLFTTLVIRELSHTLYGFLHSHERDLFLLLIEAKGIGPRMALSLMGHLSYEAFLHAVQQHDARALSRVPGIGKKTAERLLLELHDKVTSWKKAPFPISHAGPNAVSSSVQDAIQALVNLGYTHPTAKDAVDRARKESEVDYDDTGSLITAALKTCLHTSNS